MKGLGQLFLGLFVAIGVSLLVVGALSLAIVEGGIPVAVVPVEPTPTQAAPTLTPAPGQTLLPTPSRPNVQTATPTQAAQAAPAQPQPTLCPSPAGWVAYTVQAGDTLASLTQITGASAEQIQQGNCLITTTLLPGTILYLPYIQPTATFTVQGPTPVPCGPPYGWVRYTVQPGDTLFRISQAFGVTVYQLQIANCMSGTFIRAGSRLFVPNVPTRTPPVTSTPTMTPETPTAEPPTLTHTPETPVVTVAPPVTVTPSVTPTVTPSATESPTATEEPPTPTNTVPPVEPTEEPETAPSVEPN